MTDYYSLIPNFKKEIPNFLNQLKSFVILGVNSDPDSLGYMIFKNLKKELKIFPISTEPTILEEQCYKNISDIKQTIDASIITTEAKETLSACQECFENKILNIWIEAGSESKEAIDFCKDKNINLIYLHSILKEKINPSSEYKSKKDS